MELLTFVLCSVAVLLLLGAFSAIFWWLYWKKPKTTTDPEDPNNVPLKEDAELKSRKPILIVCGVVFALFFAGGATAWYWSTNDLRVGRRFVDEMRSGMTPEERIKYYSFTTRSPSIPTISYKNGSPFDQDYEKGKPLGEGGLGKVFQCTKKSDGTSVAIKEVDLMDPILAIFPTVPALLKREAALLKMFHELDSKHFVEFFEAFEENNPIGETIKVYIVMELLEGTSMVDVYEKEIPKTDVTLVIIREVLKALKVIHDHGWRHRDIKPGNIFITTDGRVKLIDFGIAGPVGEDLVTFGTPFFMPPERFGVLEWCNMSGFFGDLKDKLSERKKIGIMTFFRLFESVDIYAIGRMFHTIKVSKEMQDFVNMCLHVSPCFRPTVDYLLEHPLIKSIEGKRLKWTWNSKLAVE